MTKVFPVTDEELVAYLDGAIDPVRRGRIEAALPHDELLAARLKRLDIDTDAIRAAFGLPAEVPLSGLHGSWRRVFQTFSGASWLKPVAVVIVGIALGLAIGASDILDGLTHRTKNWRVAIADYQVLYSTATLSSLARDSPTLRGEIATVAAKLRLPIDFELLQVKELDFKRAQLLEFKDEPLAQFAYLDAMGKPIAFCATRTGEADSNIRTGIFDGLAAAFWNKNGYGFIVIGGKNVQTVERIATELASRM
jgi:anti-sigma factor RsiW